MGTALKCLWKLSLWRQLGGAVKRGGAQVFWYLRLQVHLHGNSLEGSQLHQEGALGWGCDLNQSREGGVHRQGVAQTLKVDLEAYKKPRDPSVPAPD